MIDRRTAVRFNHVGEFLGEVTRDAGLVEWGIVRLTRGRRMAAGGPIHYLLVYAGALVEQQAICLTVFAGEDWGREMRETKRAYERADELVNRLRDACEPVGLEVRAGAFEEMVQ